MSNTVGHAKVVRMTQLAILVAVMLLFAFTPLGYLKTAGVEISFMMIPVVIGAIVIGPGAGAALGAVFGITSFIQCFGMSLFGGPLLAINPFYTFLTCMIPRILAGWLPGLIFRALNKIDKTRLLSFGAASLSGALLNTILFIAMLLLLFGNTEYILSLQGDLSVLAFAVAFVGFNSVLEAAFCLVAGTAVSKALMHFSKKGS